MGDCSHLEVCESPQRPFRGHDEQVKGWHEGPQGSFRRLAYDYLHGDGEFLFPCFSESAAPSVAACCNGDRPFYIAAISATADVNAGRKIGQKPPDHLARNTSVICGWDKQFVLVEDVEFVDEHEIVVPSRIRIETFESCPDIFGCAVYLSCFKGSFEATLPRWKRELDSPEGLGIFTAVGSNDLPHAMIECSSQIVDCVPYMERQLGYDGFIALRPDGAFSSLVICFDGVAERAAFLNQAVGVCDVLLGPLNLKGVAGCHDGLR